MVWPVIFYFGVPGMWARFVSLSGALGYCQGLCNQGCIGFVKGEMRLRLLAGEASIEQLRHAREVFGRSGTDRVRIA